MTQTGREQLVAYLKEARRDAAKADDQIERQLGLIEDLQLSGADSLNAKIALKALEAERDLHYGRIEMILNQLDLDK